VVFVSGGLGSGKTLFTQLCAKHGAKVLNADEIVKELYSKDSQMLSELQEILGPEIVNQDGEVDKKLIATLIFSNDTLRQKVEAVIHPRVQNRLLNESKSTDLLVYEIPVLNSRTNLSLANYVVYVEAPEGLRLERAVERGMDFEDAKSRIEVQRSNTYVPENAILIQNSGSVDELEKSVINFLAKVSND
jgi:dephospho-CoA kinase